MVKVPKFETLEPQYAVLWSTLKIKPEWNTRVYQSARTIIANRKIYEHISQLTNVPWQFIGVIHKLESDCDFGTHLHNGDSLKRRTRLVPANRPDYGTGPYTFEESAIDALSMPGKEYHKVTDWSIEHQAYLLEKYNGWGYRFRGKNSPYLWSGSTHYTSGKFTSDKVYNARAVSEQIGCMLLLKAIEDLTKTTEYTTVKKNSRRLKFIDTVKKFIAGLTIPFGISISFLQEVKEFASDHAGVIILGGLVLGWTAFKYIEFMSRREVDEGRYQIKGEEKYV